MRSELPKTVLGSDVKFTGGNFPPTPSFVSLIESTTTMSESATREEMLDMWIKAGPSIKFVYEEKDVDGLKLREYIRQFSEFVTGRVIQKSKLVFDMEFETKCRKYQFLNVFLTNAEFEDDCVVLEFVYDWYRFDIIDG